ncbi:hypothetical protein GQ44DRAFT_611175 [Phaeosphaeriaceae sp. PMI808]|nr:hypothetical protein GQ44DRAFT_611175 [Phaeosphaeriaceae sp. PMI808]
MLDAFFLVSLISKIHIVLSLAISKEPYMCGYVLPMRNVSLFTGLMDLQYCAPFFFNETLNDYQEAFAYSLFGRCVCHSDQTCAEFIDSPIIKGPTQPNEPVEFSSPKPKWYYCSVRLW